MLPITGRNERIVLAVLAAWEGDVVSADRLIDALWGDQPPRSATKVVQNLVLRLRKVLGTGAIESRPGGYVLHAADRVDIGRFDRLVMEGQASAQASDWEASAHALGEAIGLWRGAPLVDLAGWEPGRWEAARLEEQYAAPPRSWSKPNWPAVATANSWRTCTPWSPRSRSARTGGHCSCSRCTGADNRRKRCRAYQRASSSLGELGLVPGAELGALERAISAGDLSIGPRTLGRLPLKDLPEFADPNLRSESPGSQRDTAVDLPPLPSLDVVGNLPRQVTTFVGREAQLASLADLVPGSSLVTLTGVGGVGKTRLALEVAAQVVGEFRDGAWLCEFAPVTDPGAVWETLAASLRVQPSPGRGLEESVVEYLAAKRLLLVLDNCEHLLDAVAHQVDAIVHGCARVSVLATSREGLALGGERMVAVPSLGVPSGDADDEEVLSAEAVQLFGDRASAARSDFVLTGRNVERGRGVVPAPRRHPVGDRAGGGKGALDVTRGSRRPARSAVQAPHPG